MELIRSPSLWSTFLKNNDYKFHTCIGAGSFGDVFAVTKASTGVKLAMKRVVVRGRIAEDKYAMTEIHALMILDHPNIVVLEEFFLCKSLACIILELAPGGSLEILMAEHGDKVNDAFIRQSIRQLLSAVDYCHGLDFAHRDINPSNILIFNDNLVKLADFGLCVRCSEEETGRPILCTDYLGQEAFLAPEVKIQEPFSAKPADVWSVGCVLFFMVKKVNPPFDGTDFRKLMETVEMQLRLLNQEHNSELVYLNTVRKICTLKVSDRPDLPELLSIWDYQQK